MNEKARPGLKSYLIDLSRITPTKKGYFHKFYVVILNLLLTPVLSNCKFPQELCSSKNVTRYTENPFRVCLSSFSHDCCYWSQQQGKPLTK